MKIHWNPIIESIRRECDAGALLTGCLSPFCTVQGVEALFGSEGKVDGGYLIARWRPKELSAGVGDLEVYSYLKSRNIPLYINYDLHAKLYIFSNGSVLCASGNATGKGLGLVAKANIEAGVFVDLDLEDEIALKKIRDGSTKVDDELYERFKAAIVDNDQLDPYEDFEESFYTAPVDTPYLISNLPAMKTPEEFVSFYFLAPDEQCNRLFDRRLFICDMCNLEISGGLSAEELHDALQHKFCHSPFVRDITAKIREEGSMRFGAVTEFVQKTCRDVPIPFRREIKETVNTLYNWLCYFYDDLDWHQPGERSQVIYYTRAESDSE